MFPNFIALIPCRLSRKTRLKTIASNRTIVSAPRYFGIGNPRFDHLVGACEYPGRHVRSYSVTGKRRARFLYKTLLARHRRENAARYLTALGKWSAPSASLAPPPVRTRGTGVTPIPILPTPFRPPVRPRRRGVGEGWRVASPPLA